jgi:hypothetical protein
MMDEAKTQGATILIFCAAGAIAALRLISRCPDTFGKAAGAVNKQ